MTDTLRKGYERIIAERDAQDASFRMNREFPNDYGRGWHDGYTTAMAHCSLIAREALDPVAWAEHETEWRLASNGTDREWFERTGCCGHCGQLAEDCSCTDDDPCSCGPHLEKRTWPRDCAWCDGTGKQFPAADPQEAK